MSRYCTPDCIQPSRSQAHCTGPHSCHRTFSGVGPFDEHRRDGQCADPLTLGMEPNQHGVWRHPSTDEDRARLAALRPPKRGDASAQESPNTPVSVPTT
jgi:hypothetical protein